MTALEAFNLGKEHGVTPAELHVILIILSDPPMMPTRIAKLTSVSASAVTGLVDRMEAKGWVERVKYHADRRATFVNPTEKAFEIFQNVTPEHQQ